MEKAQIDKLHNLSIKEKYEIIHMLWDDIANEQNSLNIPKEHKTILDKRLAKIKSGKANFRSWDEIKLKYKSAQ